MKRERWRPVGSAPCIGPCHDPLDLWFLEFDHNGHRVRRYYADRAEALRMLNIHQQLGVDPNACIPPPGGSAA